LHHIVGSSKKPSKFVQVWTSSTGQSFDTYGKYTNLTILVVHKTHKVDALRNGVDILIATQEDYLIYKQGFIDRPFMLWYLMKQIKCLTWGCKRCKKIVSLLQNRQTLFFCNTNCNSRTGWNVF
jgi:hypothetical protein